MNSEIEELRAATRAAHEALKDMRAVLKECEQKRVEIRRTVESLIHNDIKAIIGEEVAVAVEELGLATQRAMRASVANVTGEMERLASIALGKDDGGPSLEDLILRRKTL